MGAVKIDLGETGGKGLIDLIHPVGSIYQSFESTEPSNLFPGTEWDQITGVFLRAGNDTNTGGEDEVKLTISNMPAHSHTQFGYPFKTTAQISDSGGAFVFGGAAGTLGRVSTDSNGVGTAHNNMPAYQNVYTWKRIA